MFGVLLGTAALAACGGDDDDSETDTSSTNPAQVTSTIPSAVTTTTPTIPTETTPTTPATPVYVTEGASVLVANASRINGAAGRLSERIAAVGFTTVEPNNSTEGPLDGTKIYYDPANTAAQAVAESLKAAFGGGSIEVLAVPTPPPIESGDLLGASVLVAMGNDIADKSLEELQGLVTTTSAAASTTGESSPSSTTA